MASWRKKWAADERIPSVHDLAASIEVNLNTVMRAYTFLQDQDIITNKRGIGFFVANDSVAKIIELKRAGLFSKKAWPLFATMLS